MINQFVLAAGCAREQAKQLLQAAHWQFEVRKRGGGSVREETKGKGKEDPRECVRLACLFYLSSPLSRPPPRRVCIAHVRVMYADGVSSARTLLRKQSDENGRRRRFNGRVIPPTRRPPRVGTRFPPGGQREA